MAKRTPQINTPDGRVVTVAQIHWARYASEHLQLFAELAELEIERLRRPLIVLDPMAGTGRIHEIAGPFVWTIANEIERPYVEVARQLHPGRLTVCGDAGRLHLPQHSVDCVFVSPDFGNRGADSHIARDACRCAKADDATPTSIAACRSCGGTGISKRRSYAHDLRRLTNDPERPLTAGSSAGFYSWQSAYWDHQARYWLEARRVLRPGGLIAVDVKDHDRTVTRVRAGVKTTSKQRQRVVAGHRLILQRLGFELEAAVPLAAPGLRYGANFEARADEHVVLLARAPGSCRPARLDDSRVEVA